MRLCLTAITEMSESSDLERNHCQDQHQEPDHAAGRVRRRLSVGPSGAIAFVLGDEDAVLLRRPGSGLEAVIGSIPALPGESLDLDREIEEATEEEMQRLMQRWQESSIRNP